MNLLVAYASRSRVAPDPRGLAISLAPNLRRDRVSYSGTLRQPLRFREAISALHDIVISDLRFKPRDKSAYEAYKAQERERENQIRRSIAHDVKDELLARAPEPMPVGLEQQFNACRTRYWKARDRYSRHLTTHDPELWRLLMPCDPVITVAPDVVFFECFSADESSYGCLSVDRAAFTNERDVALGTTNVDYSWDLYEHFQTLRSYRETRFEIDPAGFSVATALAIGGSADYREEKIDLPPSWLRGFMQLQSAMSLPMRRVPIALEGLYNVVAFLKRHRAKRSPRALRFELEPGRPIQLVLGAVGKTHRAARHALSRQAAGDDPHLGPRSSARACARVAAGRTCRGVSARHRAAELLGAAPGRHAADAGAVRLDGERLDRRQRPGPDRAAGRAEQ